MALKDTFVKSVKHTDGMGLYLHVKDAGKYWRMNYRLAGKQKTLALGIYPAVTLAKARQRRDKARELLAYGIDPSTAIKEAKAEKVALSVNTFKAVAFEWRTMKAKGCAVTTSTKRLAHLESHISPAIGSRPVAGVRPPEILAMFQMVTATGTAYTAGRLREICGQVFR